MNPDSLQALLVDRELGELPAEAVELLEAWLAEHPESAPAVSSIQRTLAATSAAVRRFPELARVESHVIAFPPAHIRLVPWALAASFFVLLGAASWLGFRAGQESAQRAVARRSAPVFAAPAIKQDGPWARYALASDPRGGLTVVRRDTNPQP